MTMLDRAWIAVHPDASGAMHLAVGVAFAAFALINAWAVMRLCESTATRR